MGLHRPLERVDLLLGIGALGIKVVFCDNDDVTSQDLSQSPPVGFSVEHGYSYYLPRRMRAPFPITLIIRARLSAPELMNVMGPIRDIPAAWMDRIHVFGWPDFPAEGHSFR